MGASCTARTRNGNADGAITAPPGCHPPFQCIIRLMNNFRPFYDQSGFAANGKPDVFCLVAILFFNSRPSHVTRLVVSVIVNSIKRMFGGRFFAQFIVKMFKRIKTKFNATSAVSMEVFNVGVVAPNAGVQIRTVFPGAFAAVCLAVAFIGQTFCGKTAARFNVAGG